MARSGGRGGTDEEARSGMAGAVGSRCRGQKIRGRGAVERGAAEEWRTEERRARRARGGAVANFVRDGGRGGRGPATMAEAVMGGGLLGAVESLRHAEPALRRQRGSPATRAP